MSRLWRRRPLEEAARSEAAAQAIAHIVPPVDLPRALGQLHQLADGARALTHCFKEVWEQTSLSEVESAPRSDSAPDELYLLPKMELVVVRLGELGGVLQQAIKESSRSLATEAVQFALAGLWSRLPNIPVEEAMEGSGGPRI